MFVMTSTTVVEKFTAQTDEALRPVEALLQKWSDQMAPKPIGAETVQPEK